MFIFSKIHQELRAIRLGLQELIYANGGGVVDLLELANGTSDKVFTVPPYSNPLDESAISLPLSPDEESALEALDEEFKETDREIVATAGGWARDIKRL